MSVIPDFSSETYFKLLYRGSRDGWRGQEDFHRLCDSKGPTITLVQSNVDRVCGAYTSVPFNTKGDWMPDDKAVVFSVDSSLKFPCIDVTRAVLHHSGYGPVFGK